MLMVCWGELVLCMQVLLLGSWIADAVEMSVCRTNCINMYSDDDSSKWHFVVALDVDDDLISQQNRGVFTIAMTVAGSLQL
jgi:major membrane immunogen (membrane-anchored lipoprotein)